MNPVQTKLKINAWVAKTCKARNLDPQTVDLDAYFDSTLNFSDNQQLFRLAYPEIFKEELLVRDVRDLQEQAYRQQKVIFDEQLKTRETEALELLKAQPEAQDETLAQFFTPLESIYDTFLKSDIPLLIVQSKHGLGKSHHALKALANSNKKFHVVNGKATAIQLFIEIYKHNDSVIVLEDLPYSLLKSKDFLAMLKAATFNVSGIRRVDWLTSSKILVQESVPSSFECHARFIIIANELPTDEDFNALVSRGLNYRIPYQPHTIKRLFLALANSAVTIPLEATKRLEVATFLVEKASLGVDLHLRLFFHACEIARVQPDSWRAIVETQLKEDDTLKGFYEALEFSVKREEQARYFQEQTGLSRRSFFLYLKKIQPV